MKVSTHLQFRGQCEAAFKFYERVLGGNAFLMTHAQSPTAAEVPPDWREKILHATLPLGDTELAGADVRPAQYRRPQGFSVLLSVSNHGEGERIFAALAAGGEIHFPFQKTFWSSGFGVLVDQFGTPWEVTVGQGAG
jgi:PhnB protein